MSSNNLKVDPLSIGDVDVLIAAGWSPSRIGAALIRLQSEWDSAAHPRAMQRADFQTAYDVEGRAHAQHLADTANEQEARSLFAKLKSLPAVQEQLAARLARMGAASLWEKASAMVRWWLQRRCDTCTGMGFSHKAGKACKRCGASGEKSVLLGEEGKRMANFLDDCVQRAQRTMRRSLWTTTSVLVAVPCSTG